MKIIKSLPKEKAIELGKECSQCHNCCRYGSGALEKEDYETIASFLKISKEELKKKYLEEITKFNTTRYRPKLIRKNKPYGVCIFFDNGCTIHEVKPIECKIGTCSKHGQELSIWFALNYYVDPNDAQSIRDWASYLQANPSIEGGSLAELVPDKAKLKKILSYKIIS